MYRATWPISVKVNHAEAYHVEWEPKIHAYIQHGEMILFRVKGIEKNQITKNRLNMTYHCKLLIHFKPFEPNAMMELKENIVAAAKLRDWRH